LEFVVFVRGKAQVDDGLAQPRRGELLAREDPDRSDASILSSGEASTSQSKMVSRA
jgi:hypothetical protein